MEKSYTSRRPFPVETSMEIAVAKPIMARRPSHTLAPWLSFALCSHLMDMDLMWDPAFLVCAFLWNTVNIVLLFINYYYYTAEL